MQSVRACAVGTQKQLPNKSEWGSMCSKSCFLFLKRGVEKQVEESVRQSERYNVSPFSKPPWQPPSRAHYSHEKQRDQTQKNVARAPVLCFKILSELVSITDVFANLQCQEHIACDLTRPGQRPPMNAHFQFIAFL